MGLPHGEKTFEDIYKHLHTIPAFDRQTDGQTSCHGILRTMHTRRAVKMLFCPASFSFSSSSSLLITTTIIIVIIIIILVVVVVINVRNGRCQKFVI